MSQKYTLQDASIRTKYTFIDSKHHQTLAKSFSSEGLSSSFSYPIWAREYMVLLEAVQTVAVKTVILPSAWSFGDPRK